MEPRDPVHTIAIEQRDGGIPEIGCPIDKGLGQRGALKKTEGGGRVQFDVAGHKNSLHTKKRFTTEDTEDTEVNQYRFLPP
jgi:hypothetical protein